MGPSELTWFCHHVYRRHCIVYSYLGVFRWFLFTFPINTVHTALRFFRRLRCPLPLLFAAYSKKGGQIKTFSWDGQLELVYVININIYIAIDSKPQ